MVPGVQELQRVFEPQVCALIDARAELEVAATGDEDGQCQYTFTCNSSRAGDRGKEILEDREHIGSVLAVRDVPTHKSA